MTDYLPWIIVLLAIALAAGFALGRRAAGRRVPAITPAVQSARPASAPAAGPAPAAAMAASRRDAVSPTVRSVPAVAHPTTTMTAAAVTALSAARSWGYQLQDLDLAKAAASSFDVLVVDYARDGTDATALTSADLARLQKKPDGSRRLVIAYLSVGEAESYRYYWQKTWKRDKPAWLLGENPEWDENYAVCFWDPGWQQLICGAPDAYLDRILAQGFDGIYLDKCDVTDDLRKHFKLAARSRPNLDGDMIAFVQRLSAYAKARRPGFLVVMQNAENLLETPALRAVIDGVAKEELLYGLDAAERANTKGEIAASRDLLDLLKDDGKPVFVVEYLDNAAKMREAAATAKELGYVLYVAPKDRELDRLNGGGAAV